MRLRSAKTLMQHPQADETNWLDGEDPFEGPHRYRTVWISDLHMGTPACNAEGLLEFLKTFRCDKLYLVGDFIDLWALRRSVHWRQSFNDVLQKLLRRARKGTQIVYIPGNHDEFVTNILGRYGNIRICENDLHETLDGRRLMVLHGHEFDGIIRHMKWLALAGDVGYHALLILNRHFNRLRARLGYDYWSLSAFVKGKVKNAVNFVSRFEKAVVKYARLHAADGVVCGHIHTAAIKRFRDIEYYNTGDWVESHTALVEHYDGTIELVHWRRTAHASSARSREVPAPAGILAFADR